MGIQNQVIEIAKKLPKKKQRAWTPERTERAAEMWKRGSSGGQIAEALGGGLTRNAVIGKMDRIGAVRPPGLDNNRGGRGLVRGPRTAGIFTKPAAPKKSKSLIQTIKQARREAINEGIAELKGIEPDAMIVPLAERRNVVTATKCQCRWCYGDPLKSDFHFCDKDVIPGLSYCKLHAAKVYNTVPDSRGKKQEDKFFLKDTSCARRQ